MPASDKALEAALRYLAPPGDGVHAMSVYGDVRRRVQSARSGGGDVRAAWAASLASVFAAQGAAPRCVVLGVPSDTGAGGRRGASFGPLFLRDALDRAGARGGADAGDVRVVPHLLHDKYLNDRTIDLCRRALYGDAESRLPVSPLSIAEHFADAALEAGDERGLFTIGGDHSASYPVVRAYLRSRARRAVRAAVLHFDAHTDLMGERLGIDLTFGSWARQLLGELSSPSDWIQVGLRTGTLDRAAWRERLGVEQVWRSEIAERGAAAVGDRVADLLVRRGVREVYVSFDVDVLDEIYAGATGTPAPDGLSPDEALTILRAVRARVRIASGDVMEIAPTLHAPRAGQDEPRTTLDSASAIASFLISAIEEA